MHRHELKSKFTFHYVSIISCSPIYIIIHVTYLHSIMFLLFR